MHPSMRVLEHALEGAAARANNAGRWDNPELSVEIRDERFDGGSAVGTLEAVIMQPLPLSGRTRLARMTAEQERAIKLREITERRRLLAFNTENAVNDWLNASATIAEVREALAASRELLDFLQQQVERGEASSLDAAAMEIDVLEGEWALQQAKSQARQAWRGLSSAIGRDAPQDDPPESLSIEMLPEPTIEEPVDAVLERRPDLQIAALQNELTASHTALARARRWQDVAAGLIVESGYGGDEDVTTLGAGFSLPLPLWNRNTSEVDEALTREAIADAEYRQHRFYAAAGIMDARNDWLDARKRLDMMKDRLLPGEEQRQAAIRTAYEKGELGFVELRQARENWVRLRAEKRQAEAALRAATARLRFIQADYQKQTLEHTKE